MVFFGCATLEVCTGIGSIWICANIFSLTLPLIHRFRGPPSPPGKVKGWGSNFEVCTDEYRKKLIVHWSNRNIWIFPLWYAKINISNKIRWITNTFGILLYLPRRGRGTAEAVDEGNRRTLYVCTNRKTSKYLKIFFSFYLGFFSAKSFINSTSFSTPS